VAALVEQRQRVARAIPFVRDLGDAQYRQKRKEQRAVGREQNRDRRARQVRNRELEEARLVVGRCVLRGGSEREEEQRDQRDCPPQEAYSRTIVTVTVPW
jgi:hypothetical protein